VNARQHADLDGDLTDLVEGATVEALSALEDLVAEDFLLELLEDRLGLDLPLDFLVGNVRDQVGEDLVYSAIVLELVLDPHGVGERNQDFFFDFTIELPA